jgi:hypothetical protein
MNAADLIKYDLKPVAKVRIEDRKLLIEISDSDSADREECIYAFLIGGRVARIGSSKAPLRGRLRNYERDITNALNGKYLPTPEEEAQKWSRLLPSGTFGEIYARQGAEVRTPVGVFRAYMDEERILIGRLFKEEPPDRILNRCKYR